MTAGTTFAERLDSRMRSVNSLLCIGLDPVPSKLPSGLGGTIEATRRFCLDIVEATQDAVCCYKPNLAFFTQLGPAGLQVLWDIRQAIPRDIPVLLDCKVGDVGETARAYARGWFDEFDFDAITVNPYMGEDSLEPFLSRDGRGVIVICKTSNPGSGDIQDVTVEGGEAMFLTVADRCRDWESRYPASVGLVVGATYPEQLAAVRGRVGDQPILLPGVGAQGGDLAASLQVGRNSVDTGLICSASRSVLFASSGSDYAEAAEEAARALRDEIRSVTAGAVA
jgi:orotidine-5'-phosphate decarboxylase